MKTEIIKGDLIDLANSGKFHAIAHGCNCFNSMSGGVAKQIADAFPSAKQADDDTRCGTSEKLGKMSVSYDILRDMSQIAIFNLYTQYSPGEISNDSLTDLDSKLSRMKAIKKAFEGLAKFIHQEFDGEHLILGIPKIGSGIAGGDWVKILPVIEDALKDVNGTLYVVEYEK